MSKINEYIKIASLFMILMTIGVFYRRYDDKLLRESKDRNDSAIRDYLLTDPDKLGAISTTRPILWIPIHYSYNSRKWQSFGSRSSYDLNQPYIYLTVKSIIKYCKDSFHVCLVDDDSYVKLMPDWKYGGKNVPDPIMEHARKLAVIRLLNTYGGMTVPPSFLCVRNLEEMFNNSLAGANSMFVSETISKSTSCADYSANISIMGCKPNSHEMDLLDKYLTRLIEIDNTNAMDCTGKISAWCNKMVTNRKINMVSADLIGVRDNSGYKVQVEELMSNEYLDFNQHMYGILIPSQDILNRTAYQWFARLSGEQVLTSNTIIGKYILVANIPEQECVLEPDDTEKPEWISYWEVPSDAPVWGVKPNHLGDKVQSLRSLK